MRNLMTGLIEELERCSELKKVYDDIGASGKFGSVMIQKDIDEAKKAIADGDLTAMIGSMAKLKGCQ